MAYCTYTELTNLTGTTLSQAVQEAIIAQSDREIDAMLDVVGLSADSGDIIKTASLEFSIAGVMTRHRMDGTMPSGITMGGLTMSDNIDAAIAEHRARGIALVNQFISKSKDATKTKNWVVITNG